LGPSRKILLDEYKAWLRDNYDSFNELYDVEEHISFVRTVKSSGNIKYEADTGKHDDRVISRALAIYGNNRWEEEVAYLNDDKSDYTNIVKIGNISYTKQQSYKQSKIGNNTGLSRVKVIGKQSSIGN
jgi:hypothetical protein